jgi:hypothetical protein
MDLSMLAATMTSGPEGRLFSLADCDNDASEVHVNRKHFKEQWLARYFEEK